MAPPHHNQEEQQARDNPQRDGQKQPDRPHERAQESPYVGPHDPFSAAEMGQHIGSSGIRSPPAGTEHQDIELARISQELFGRATARPNCRRIIRKNDVKLFMRIRVFHFERIRRAAGCPGLRGG